MLHLNVPLILVLMVKWGLTFGEVQDKLKDVDVFSGMRRNSDAPFGLEPRNTSARV